MNYHKIGKSLYSVEQKDTVWTQTGIARGASMDADWYCTKSKCDILYSYILQCFFPQGVLAWMC